MVRAMIMMNQFPLSWFSSDNHHITGNHSSLTTQLLYHRPCSVDQLFFKDSIPFPALQLCVQFSVPSSSVQDQLLCSPLNCCTTGPVNQLFF